MTPAERVAFILHDVFRYPFAEVAGIVGRTPAACRQLASSARRRIRAAQAPVSPAARQADIVRDFQQAWEAKDIDAIIACDFLVVETVLLRRLYVLVFIEHGTRR
jgi:Sigma-70, region 4